MKKNNIWLTEAKNTLFDSLIFTLLTTLLLLPVEDGVLVYLLDNVVTESLGLNSFTYTFCASTILTGIVFCAFGPFVGGKISGIDETIGSPKVFIASPPCNPFNINFILYKYVVHPLTMLNISFGTGSLGVILGVLLVSLKLEDSCSATLVFLSGYIMLFPLVLVSRMLKYFWHGNEYIYRPFFAKDKEQLSLRAVRSFKALALVLSLVFLCVGYTEIVIPLQNVDENGNLNPGYEKFKSEESFLPGLFITPVCNA